MRQTFQLVTVVKVAAIAVAATISGDKSAISGSVVEVIGAFFAWVSKVCAFDYLDFNGAGPCCCSSFAYDRVTAFAV